MSEDYGFEPVLSEEVACQFTSPQETVVLTLLYETVDVTGEKALADC